MRKVKARLLDGAAADDVDTLDPRRSEQALAQPCKVEEAPVAGTGDNEAIELDRLSGSGDDLGTDLERARPDARADGGDDAVGTDAHGGDGRLDDTADSPAIPQKLPAEHAPHSVEPALAWN
jgi:hypothetical protein